MLGTLDDGSQFHCQFSPTIHCDDRILGDRYGQAANPNFKSAIRERYVTDEERVGGAKQFLYRLLLEA
ncbi:MAG: hypothetical protein AB7I09_20875 [Planctomycetota bacterium]